MANMSDFEKHRVMSGGHNHHCRDVHCEGCSDTEPTRLVGGDRLAPSGFGIAPAGDTGHARKLDMGKPPIAQGFIKYFARAMVAVSFVSEYGSRKYARPENPYSLGWQDVQNGEGRFADADARHRVKAFPFLEGNYDRESGLAHLAHKAWNALAELELALKNGRVECRIGNEIEDGAPVPDTFKAVEL